MSKTTKHPSGTSPGPARGVDSSKTTIRELIAELAQLERDLRYRSADDAVAQTLSLRKRKVVADLQSRHVQVTDQLPAAAGVRSV